MYVHSLVARPVKIEKKRQTQTKEITSPTVLFTQLSMAHTKASWPNHKTWDAKVQMTAQWNADEGETNSCFDNLSHGKNLPALFSRHKGFLSPLPYSPRGMTVPRETSFGSSIESEPRTGAIKSIESCKPHANSQADLYLLLNTFYQ